MRLLGRLPKYEKLSVRKVAYEQDIIEIDGYYVNVEKEDEKTLVSMLFFYRDGVIYHPIKTVVDSKKNPESSFFELSAKYDTFEKNKNVPYAWGVYKVDSAEVVVRQWGPGTGIKDMLFTSKYSILDSRTIRHEYDNAIYHFKPYSPKPDSTNVFTENTIK